MGETEKNPNGILVFKQIWRVLCT